MDGNLGWVEWLFGRLWRRLPPELQRPFLWLQRLVWGVLGRIRPRLEWAWDQATSPLYRNAFYIMLASVVGSALGFFFWVVVPRFYTGADIGWALLLFQTVSFLSSLALFGLGIALIRYLPEEKDPVTLVNACLTIVGLTALVVSVVFVLGVQVFYREIAFIWDSPVYLAAIIILAMASAFAPILDQTGYAIRRADLLTWRTLIFSIVKVALPLAFAFIAVLSGRLGVFMALCLGFGVSVAIEGYLLLPRALPGFRPRPVLEIGRVRHMVRFSLGNYAANTIASAGSSLLPALIVATLGSSAGPTEVTYFYVAMAVAGLLYIIPGATFTSFYAEASQKNARRHMDERRTIALTLALLVPAMGVLWFASEPMLYLFGSGPQYVDGAVGPLRILVFAALPAFANSVLGTRVRVRKQSLPLIIGASITTVIVLVLGFSLLRTMGIEGLAIAYVIGSAAAIPYYYAVARRNFQGEEPETLEPTQPQV